MSRTEMVKLVERATPEERQFLERLLHEWRAPQTAGGDDEPAADDPFYRLHEQAVDDLKPLTNAQMDKIVYGVD